MNPEPDIEPCSETNGYNRQSAAPAEALASTSEPPFYIVPAPPVPGKTGWSIAPL